MPADRRRAIEKDNITEQETIKRPPPLPLTKPTLRILTPEFDSEVLPGAEGVFAFRAENILGDRQKITVEARHGDEPRTLVEAEFSTEFGANCDVSVPLERYFAPREGPASIPVGIHTFVCRLAGTDCREERHIGYCFASPGRELYNDVCRDEQKHCQEADDGLLITADGDKVRIHIGPETPLWRNIGITIRFVIPTAANESRGTSAKKVSCEVNFLEYYSVMIADGPRNKICVKYNDERFPLPRLPYGIEPDQEYEFTVVKQDTETETTIVVTQSNQGRAIFSGSAKLEGTYNEKPYRILVGAWNGTVLLQSLRIFEPLSQGK
ncbi:MAG: hypothetical protein RDV41_08990 [Planctomycetota bacterium]|nr:hypothetical protein [Planctomycetota bacterium]